MLLLIVYEGKLEYLKEVYKGNRRIIDLVDTFLNVSRIELGKFSVKLETVDVLASVQSIIDEAKFECEKKGIIVEKDFPNRIEIKTDLKNNPEH